MKLRSLFLASLAALAMVSCNNENDPAIDGGGENVEKKALLELGFAFPKTTVTRATEVGLATEYEFTKIAIIMDYAAPIDESGTTRVVEMLDRNAFSPVTPVANSENIVIYTKQAIKVASGTATIRAIVNPDKTADELKTITYADMKLEPTYTALNALTAAGMPAANDNFMMTNATVGISQEFKENTTTNVQIPVTRVVAKLMEMTANRTFTEIKTDLKSATEEQIRSLNIELKKATYVNLAKSSCVFPSVTPIAASWLHTYPVDWANLPSSDGKFEYMTLAGNNIHYCFENGQSTPTGIIYEAEATWNGEAARTFYIAAGKLYLTYESLSADFRECPAEGSSAKTFHDALIRKYENGKCYYYKAINTTTEVAAVPEIRRNNVYKISVTGVVKIGNPTIIIEDDETLMNLSIAVDPWTVNDNAFELD